MLIRRDGDGALLIGQASHAFLSGQLARAWGDPRFGAVEPLPEVCLAADQHDVGMGRWDLAPSFNRETGLPHSFLEMPLAVHLSLWRAGPPRLQSQSRYAALLVSAHGRRLYERRDLSAFEPDQAQAVRSLIAERRAFESRLAASLAADPATAAWVDPPLLARNSQLIWIWDYLSLALCLHWLPATARRVPLADGGSVDVELRSAEDGTLTLDPWPLRADEVSVHCEGQWLPAPRGSATELRDALAAAEWKTARFGLRRLS